MRGADELMSTGVVIDAYPLVSTGSLTGHKITVGEVYK